MNIKIIKKYFPKKAERIQQGKCPFCAKEIDPETEFRDPLSKKEFGLSGLCQKCQDKTFSN